jgi:regulator of chromosome condensation
LSLWIINCILGLGDDVLQVKKPRKIPIFSLGPGFPANKIIKIACGGQHTLALSSNGVVFSWGGNDDGALGR